MSPFVVLYQFCIHVSFTQILAGGEVNVILHRVGELVVGLGAISGGYKVPIVYSNPNQGYLNIDFLRRNNNVGIKSTKKF